MFSASEYRSRARASLNGKWGSSILVCFIGLLLGGCYGANLGDNIKVYINNLNKLGTGWFGYNITDITIFGLLFSIFAAMAGVIVIFNIARFLIGGAVELGVCCYFMKLARGEQAEVSDEFGYFPFFLKALGLRIVRAVFIMLWSLLLIVPGIIASYRYSMATYILAENPQMDIMDAINESKAMMDGYKWAKFCLDLSFIGWAILSTLTFGIGVLFLTPYICAASAHFYLSVRYENQSQNQTYQNSQGAQI